MQIYREALRKGIGYLLVWAVFLIVAGVLLTVYSKFESHTLLNGIHNEFTDAAFPFITTIAEGWLAAILLLILLWVRLRMFVFVFTAHVLSVLTTRALKLLLQHKRPGNFLDQMPDLALVPDIDLHMQYSFPSGHSTAIFSLCFAMALVLPKRRWGILLALLAILVGYSRIFLSQHFLQDVVAGSTVGTLVPLLLYGMLMHPGFGKGWNWLDKRIPFPRSRAEASKE